MHDPSAVDDRTRCGDRQPVPPFPGEYLSAGENVSNSQRRYHFFSDVGTKLKYAGCNEAVPVGVDSDIFSRIGLTICCSDP